MAIYGNLVFENGKVILQIFKRKAPLAPKIQAVLFSIFSTKPD
ncbi:hypothetical protein MHD_06690 [Mannheimia granulomatis]|uniref:Uncharacterized protein n=1 Tax=Mannheimia granulomatis TaxID=85402 RepID=A0A011M051_9PAST|nr:hypothetical protein AK33_03420 [Mannheimia granulomatis]RGE48162.1 hypothetical protein MHD_06690 [Mannheimia granulomatis]